MQACNLGKGSLTLGGVLAYTGLSVSSNRGLALAAGGGTIDVSNPATSLAFSGVITGGQAGLSKTGGGTLVLDGADSYTGLTTIAAGALELGTAPEPGAVADGSRGECNRRATDF